MFVFRVVFWFAVVALFIPRGPDLGIVQTRSVTGADIEAYRQMVLDRVAAVRQEIAADRARRGDSAKLDAIIPEAWHVKE